MISDRSDFRVQIRRLFVIMIRSSYRWICNHPFLLSFIGFLYFLHRIFPLLFSPLVAASPVLVCTFVLLGTILSFGEPNIPEIEKEPETVHETALFRTEVTRDATVFEKGDKSFTVENFMSKEKEVHEDGDDAGDNLRENQLSEAEDDGRPFDYRPLVDETLNEMKRDTHVKFEEKAFVLELEKRGEIVDEKLIENGGMQVSGAEHLRKNGGSLDELMDDSKDEQMDVSPISPWRPMRHEEDEDDDADRDDSLDSGSDGAESSSPDASMTDIIPMLDELHPLLHSQVPSRGITNEEGSDAASEGPHRSSSDEGMESDVDSESQGEEGDNENEEEEEEKKEGKDDESKSAIKWTEVDQKNVMDLGSLELERNQRLENLIARRRARHNMRLMAEKNLIDLDSADVPFNMPSISTARQNPFDLPYDMYDDMAIPGSAPSIMFARRNPFDIPYEPNEEKPDLKGDGFQEEFSSQQPKDPVFRRHESFSVGPSMLGGPRHDRLRPFFVLERLANEGTSYYPLERQLSEVSESKVSSVPDTESVCTVLEDDEKKVDEHDTDREAGIATEKRYLAADHDEEKNHSASDHDEEKSHSSSDDNEEKSHSASDHDEEKSHSSEDSDFDEQADSRHLHHDVAEIILGNAETHHEQLNAMEGETSDKRNLDEEVYSDTSLSEIEEKIPDISENEAMLISEPKAGLHDESGASSQPSFGGVEIHGVRGVDDYHHDEARAEDSFITAHPSLDESAIHELCGLVDGHPEEPVYDSSPPSGSRFPSFSSISSDYKPDLPGKNGEELQVNEDKERDVFPESIGHEDIHSTSEETETRTREVGGTSTHVTEEANLRIAEVGLDGQKNSTVSESSLPLDKNENADHQEDNPLSVSSQKNLEELHVRETLDTRALDGGASLVIRGPDDTREYKTTLGESLDVVHDIPETSVNRSVAEGIIHEEEVTREQKDEATFQTFNAGIPIDSYATLSSGAVEYVETHSFNDEDPRLEQDPVQSSVPAAEEETHPDQVMDISVDSVNASAQNVGSEETIPSELDREVTWSDKSVVEQSSLEPGEDQIPNRAGPVSVVFSRNITFHEYHDAPEDTAELSCLTSDSSSSPSESPEYTTPMVGEGSRTEFFQEDVYEEIDNVVERLDQLSDLHAVSQSPPDFMTEEADMIEDIDEGLLSELDTVGDFSVKEVVTNCEPGPSSTGTVTANETEALSVLEARSAEDIDSAFPQIQEGSEVEDVILPSTVQGQLAEENYKNSTETKSDSAVVEATSKEDLDNVMNQAVVESVGKQSKSSKSDGGSGEIKCAVETETSESSTEEKFLEETNVPLNNTSEKKEEEQEDEESKPKEITTSSVSPVETQSLEEVPKPSESKEGKAMEVISETLVIPTEDNGSSNVTLSDEVVIKEAKVETTSNANATAQSPESKETPEISGESIAEEKGKTEKD